MRRLNRKPFPIYNTLHWYKENSYIKIIHFLTGREFIISKEYAYTWELIEKKIDIRKIVKRVVSAYPNLNQDNVLEILDFFEKSKLIKISDSFWK